MKPIGKPVSARARVVRFVGRKGPGAQVLARSIAQGARVPIRSLGVELVNLKRFGIVACQPVPRSWWGLVGHRAKLWALTEYGREVYRVIGR
jgi:hypothetical protein